MARKGISGTDVAEKMGVEQSYFSRRYSGKVPWTAAELQIVCNIIDEDIIRVYAAGAAALEELRKTNLCLSHGAIIGAEHLTEWARKGLDLARRLYPTLTVDIDTVAA